VYDGREAAELVRELQPRVVIPVQYVSGSTPANCDQGSVQPFLDAMAGTPVQRAGSRINLPGSLAEGPVIKVMR
jgi:L-ascorbate metabolism protein UlaG (beta-lactamase superfamily)